MPCQGCQKSGGASSPSACSSASNQAGSQGACKKTQEQPGQSGLQTGNAGKGVAEFVDALQRNGGFNSTAANNTPSAAAA
jgi:hypothetical protein